MPKRFFTAKGNLYHISHPWGASLGAKRFELKLPKGTKALFAEDPDWAIIITGYSMKETEITAKTACINDKRVMYSFGKGFGDMTINCEALLGAQASKCKFENWIEREYEQARLNSAGGTPAQLSAAGVAIQFHITGLQIGGYIPELEILPFAWIGVLSK
jgi:hypothetical protein